MTAGSTEMQVYVCPMHPDVCRAAGGVCANCGTPLRMSGARFAQLQQRSRRMAFLILVLAVAATLAIAATAL